jgi:hypothetical protein
VSVHGYKVGDRVRLIDDGTVGVITHAEPAEYEGDQPVRVDWPRGSWWPRLRDIELVASGGAAVDGPAITGEMLAMCHGKAWQLRAAKQTGLSAATMRTYADLLDGAAVTP